MTDVLRACRRTWRRQGVPRAVAAEMAADLEADLAAAAKEGVSPEAFVARDPNAFAIAWATARGVARPRLRLALTAAAAVAGAVPGAGFALFAAYGLSSPAVGEILGGAETRVGEHTSVTYLNLPTWLIGTLYALGALFAYAGAVATVAGVLRWRLDPAAGQTVRSLAAALPVATAAAIAASVLFASTRGFSTETPVVAGDAVVALAVFGAAVVGVRVLAVLRGRARLGRAEP